MAHDVWDKEVELKRKNQRDLERSQAEATLARLDALLEDEEPEEESPEEPEQFEEPEEAEEPEPEPEEE